MKNIHILPTGTGKLYKCNQGFGYSLLGTFTGYQKDVVCQNIYVTNDEEIKELP